MHDGTMKCRIPVLVLFVFSWIHPLGNAAEWFVASGGNDAWSGTVPALVLEARDSREPGAPVVWRAYETEKTGPQPKTGGSARGL